VTEGDRSSDRWGLAGGAAAVTAAAVVYTVLAWSLPDRAGPAQAACFAAAACWLVFALAGVEVGRPRWREKAGAWAATAAVLLMAFAVRHWMLGMLPPADRSGFEELQMGSDGWRLLTSGHLPMEFRFTKAVAALGLWWGGPTLAALRLPFQLLGYVRLVLTFAVLRALGVGRAASGFLVLALAASRWAVISSGSAYEDFSATALLLLLILALAKLDLARANARAWAVFAGALAGMLMFENSSFRFGVLLAGAWVVWAVVRAPGGARAHWAPAALFAVAFVLVALPMLVDIAHNGGRSIFFEAIVRYRHERRGVLPGAMLSSLWKSLRMIAGRPVGISFFLAPEAGYAVQPLTGVLLVGGAVSGLVRPRRPFVRALVLAALAATVACAATTDFFGASRLAPVITVLFLTGGVLLQDVGRAVHSLAGWLGVAVRLPWSAERFAAATATLFYAVLAAVMVSAGIGQVRSMASNVDVRNEYLNNQYLTAAHIARVAAPGARVVVVTPGLMRDWTARGIARWLYSGRRLDVRAAARLPLPGEVAPGTVVVLAAEGRPLRPQEVGELERLARATGSAGSLSWVREAGDRTVLGSVCVRCGG
jgi:hypothetical protein